VPLLNCRLRSPNLSNLPGPPLHPTRIPSARGPPLQLTASPNAQLRPTWRGQQPTLALMQSKGGDRSAVAGKAILGSAGEIMPRDDEDFS